MKSRQPEREYYRILNRVGNIMNKELYTLMDNIGSGK